MKAARFPAYKDLSAFDFAASEIQEALVRQLHRCEFLDGAENVVLIGGGAAQGNRMLPSASRPTVTERPLISFSQTVAIPLLHDASSSKRLRQLANLVWSILTKAAPILRAFWR
jgi:hypothetical protein